MKMHKKVIKISESHGKRADTNKFTCLHTSKKKNMLQQIYRSCSYLDINVVMFESSSVYGFCTKSSAKSGEMVSEKSKIGLST